MAKFCKDCKYLHKVLNHPRYECLHPKAEYEDLVFGNKLHIEAKQFRAKLTEIQELLLKYPICGPSAIYFTPYDDR